MSTNSNTSSATGGVGFLSLLAVLFIGLKLGGVIDWSWWWVLAPLWAGLAFLLVIIAIFLLFFGIVALIRGQS